MSLDQCALGRKGEGVKNEYGEMEYVDEIYLADWSNHPNLHGFMQSVYGGGDINGVDVNLTLEDIDALEEAIDELGLPETQGFFIGDNSDEYYAEQDSKFIVDARSAIENGYGIYYYSNW
tara:strand:- start:711 stop:1070 length:360 start_codon:yes stop_codon:yes gene_type:complete